MFIFPKYILQHIGLLLGYFFNFMIAGVGIKMAYESYLKREWSGVFFGMILAILVLLWTFRILNSSYKEFKSKQKNKTP